MKVNELTQNQLRQLKESYYTEKHISVSYGELAMIDNLVSDDEIFEVYSCTNFVEEDFNV